MKDQKAIVWQIWQLFVALVTLVFRILNCVISKWMNKVAIELWVVQFWSEIIIVISNRSRAARSFDFEITRMISDQIALHSVQLPLLIFSVFVIKLL